MSALSVRGVSKRFGADRHGRGGTWVLHEADLQVAPGECVSLLGPSGCGKSTLLNCIAGLLQPDEGTIAVDGQPVHGPGPERSVVFQHPSLLPWRTALRNVAYGVQLQHRRRRSEVRDRARAALELVGLGAAADKYPGQLSGGMRQRVNLARALATDPAILLMDEPFGALDALTRERMQDELLRILRGGGQSVVFVTHDIEEALYLGDRVVVMASQPGRIRAVVEVPFGRPRGRDLVDDAAFVALRRHLRTLLAEVAPRSVALAP